MELLVVLRRVWGLVKRPSTNGADAAIFRHCSTSAAVRISRTRYIRRSACRLARLLLVRRGPVECDEQCPQRRLEIVVGHQPQPLLSAGQGLDRDSLDVVDWAHRKGNAAPESIARADLFEGHQRVFERRAESAAARSRGCGRGRQPPHRRSGRARFSIGILAHCATGHTEHQLPGFENGGECPPSPSPQPFDPNVGPAGHIDQRRLATALAGNPGRTATELVAVFRTSHTSRGPRIGERSFSEVGLRLKHAGFPVIRAAPDLGRPARFPGGSKRIRELPESVSAAADRDE